MTDLREITGEHLTEMRVRLEEQAHNMGEAAVAAKIMKKILIAGVSTGTGVVFTPSQHSSLLELQQTIYDAVR